MKFRTWFESADIFGFNEKKHKEDASDDILQRPIINFDIELMMEFLGNKRIGLHQPNSQFMNEMQWGDEPGAVKLKVDTGYTFYVKKMTRDLQGQDRWITKKMFQLNRQGYGGQEDTVAGEVYDHLARAYSQPIDGPKEDYIELENLVYHISNKIRRVAKDVLMYESIKKMDDYHYQIIFAVRGQGVEAPDHTRIEQNVTGVTYDKEAGTIRVTNYNVESPVGGPHSWSVAPIDLDLYFLPTQSRDEISEAICVHFKYY